MNKSTVKSRIEQKKRQRRNKRNKRIYKLVSGLALVVLAAVFLIVGIRSGLNLSRNIKYPVQYSEYISRYAKENELDPYVVIALIKQESNFVADARSKYAGGLMQLTEATAHEYAAKLGLENYDYMSPQTNIQIGCYVLKTLIDKYGVLDTALAAYNAGPGNVDEWLENPGYSVDGKTLSYIPYGETRGYVTKINKYIEEYKEQVKFEN